MKFVVIIATMVVCTCAASMAELLHPSPVNPNVLIKFKRETKQPLYPTVVPEIHVHHLSKRDHKPGHETKPITKSNTPNQPQKTMAIRPTTSKKLVQKPEPSKQPSSHKRNRRDIEKVQISQASNSGRTARVEPQEQQTPQAILPATLEAVYHPKYKLPEQTPKDNNEKESQQEKDDKENVTRTAVQKVEGFPAIFSSSNKVNQQIKRDIPVPLVPKHHHPEESPKDSSSEIESHEDKKHENKDNHEYVTTDGFQKPQILPAILKETTEANQQHKRDIPVPLVAKRQHQEESPKELNMETQHVVQKPQSLPNHKNEHITTEGFQKPQTLPAILKESTEANQQHKLGLPKPLVAKHEHPEESLKDSIQKEFHEDKKKENTENHHVIQTHHIPHTFPLINHEGIHKPQILLGQHNEHIVPTGLQKPQIPKHITTEGFHNPQTLPPTLKETTETEPQRKRNIPVPLLAEDQHPEESRKESHKNQKEEKSTENHHIENYPNIHEVQVEDLSESKPFHQTLNHAQPTHVDSKPNILDDHGLAVPASHPVIRSKPLPVAELFARVNHDN